MASAFHPMKVLRDAKRLKEQRDAKRKKDELALMLQADKASEAYVEALFLWKLYEEGKCWDSVQKVQDELSKLNTKMAKIRALK